MSYDPMNALHCDFFAHQKDRSLRAANEEVTRLKACLESANRTNLNLIDTLTRCQAECTRLLEENRRLEAERLRILGLLEDERNVPRFPSRCEFK